MINYEKYYTDIKATFVDTSDSLASTYVLHHNSGYIRRIPVDRGIEMLFMNNLNYEQALDVTHLSTENAVEINYCFAGEIYIQFQQTMEKLFMRSGQLCFNSLRGAVCVINKEAVNHTGISVFIQQDALERLLLSPYSEVDSAELSQLMQQTFYDRTYTLTAGNIAIKSLAEDLLKTDFPLDRPLKELAFRKRTMSLLYETAEYILGMTNATYNSPQIEIAKAILFDNLVNPPSLERLATMCNLSITSLKSGFKTHYSDTVYGVLRKERMLRAKQHLIEGASVAEAAAEVGYANPSQFAKAFKEQYGIPPKEFKSHN